MLFRYPNRQVASCGKTAPKARGQKRHRARKLCGSVSQAVPLPTEQNRHLPLADPRCQGGASSLSLLVVRALQSGSRAAVGRRVSDRVATLDAGEDGRTMGDEDDASLAGHGDLRGWWVSGVPRDVWCAAGAQTYLGARTCDASGHKRIDGVPCRQVRGAAARSIEGRPACGWRAVPVWELAAPARGVLGGGLVRGHRSSRWWGG